MEFDTRPTFKSVLLHGSRSCLLSPDGYTSEKLIHQEHSSKLSLLLKLIWAVSGFQVLMHLGLHLHLEKLLKGFRSSIKRCGRWYSINVRLTSCKSRGGKSTHSNMETCNARAKCSRVLKKLQILTNCVYNQGITWFYNKVLLYIFLSEMIL